MTRSARIVFPDVPYHLTQRGVNRQSVFVQDDEYQLYLDILRRFAQKYGLTILGYCLMPDHIHLVGIPQQESSLAQVLGYTHSRFAQVTNPRHQRYGHLWHGRFYGCLLDDAQCVHALRYIERNPLRAGIVACPCEYPWSSASAHCGGVDSSGPLDLSGWSERWPGDTWQEYLQDPKADDDMPELRRWTQSGRPLGDDDFIKRLEVKAGRRLHPLPVGRPRKIAEKEM